MTSSISRKATDQTQLKGELVKWKIDMMKLLRMQYRKTRQNMMRSLWDTVWRILKKLKIKLLHNPATQLLGIYPKEMKTLTPKDSCISTFTAALCTIAKSWKQPKHPATDEWTKNWVNKLYISMYNGILISHKNETILPLQITWMNREGIMLSETSQTEKDKYCMKSLTYEI